MKDGKVIAIIGLVRLAAWVATRKKTEAAMILKPSAPATLVGGELAEISVGAAGVGWYLVGTTIPTFETYVSQYPAYKGTPEEYYEPYKDVIVAPEPVITPRPSPLPANATTIDKFELACDFGSSMVYCKITVTNHTNVTLVDETPTGSSGGKVVKMWTNAFKHPGTSYDYFLGGLFQMRDWDASGIGNLPPGTHIYSSELYKTPSLRGAFFQVREIGEGTRGRVEVCLRAEDQSPTPIAILAEADGYFEGIFSTSWQTWQKTSWRPPPPDEFSLGSVEVSF